MLLQDFFPFPLRPCVSSICALCECVIFIQVLQLSVSAPLVAYFPAEAKHSIKWLQVLSEGKVERKVEDKSSTAQLIAFHATSAPRGRGREPMQSARQCGPCVSIYFGLSSFVEGFALPRLSEILLRSNQAPNELGRARPA